MRQLILILGLVGLSTCAVGQQRNTIYQQLFDGPITTAPETSSVFYAIGQTQHKVTIQLASQPSMSCTGGFVDIYLEGSGTGAVGTYIQIGNTVSSITRNEYGQYAALVLANVAMPYVRLVVNSFDTVNCSLTALYSGTISPTDDALPPTVVKIMTIQDGVPVSGGFTDMVSASQYNRHSMYVDGTGCSAFSITLQPLARFAENLPILAVGYGQTLTSATTVYSENFGGIFPLVGFFILAGSATGCDADIYYYGSNDTGPVVPSVDTVGGNIDASNSLVIFPALGVSNTAFIYGLSLNNPCAAGTITLSGSIGGTILQVGPNSSEIWEFIPTSPLGYLAMPDQDISIVGSGLTPSCLAYFRVWIVRKFS